MIAGIDYSTRFVDVVLLDEDTAAATWHRAELGGQDGFERTRCVRGALLNVLGSAFWDDVLAIGIEDPRGYGAGSLYRVQGAIISSLPRHTLLQPWIPSAWRKTVGLPGNASKDAVLAYTLARRHDAHFAETRDLMASWPQDACDAYCIALATRMSIQVTA